MPFAKPQVISSLDASFFSMSSWPFSQSFHFDHAFPSGPKIFSLLMLVDHTLAGHARLAMRRPAMHWPSYAGFGVDCSETEAKCAFRIVAAFAGLLVFTWHPCVIVSDFSFLSSGFACSCVAMKAVI